MYDHEIRTGRNVKQIILRAAQIARSEPQGPAYLIASRECLEETIEPYEVNAKLWQPVDSSALSPRAVKEIGDALLSAKLPVVVTTYLGREPEAVKELVKLCEAAGIAVVVCLSSCHFRNTLTSQRTHSHRTSTSPTATTFTWVSPSKPTVTQRPPNHSLP